MPLCCRAARCSPAGLIRLSGPGAAAGCHNRIHTESAHLGVSPAMRRPRPTTALSPDNTAPCLDLSLYFGKCDERQGVFPQGMGSWGANWFAPLPGACGSLRSAGGPCPTGPVLDTWDDSLCSSSFEWMDEDRESPGSEREDLNFNPGSTYNDQI